jgi:integrase
MAYVYKHAKRGWYLVLRLASGNRSQIYLGQMPKSRAETIARRVDELSKTNAVGLQPDPQIANWLSCCAPEFLAKLERVHLLRLWRRPSDVGLLAWWDAYLETRTDFEPGTLKGFKTARNHVAATFGTLALSELTPALAKQFPRDLLACGLSASHVSKIADRLSQICRGAIDSGLLAANPCAGIRVTPTVDATRRVLIDTATAQLVLDHMPHAEGRALFALARWGGCRVPHEPLALEWNHIDWHARRISIPRKTKTGARVFPLFPELEKELSALYTVAPDGSQWVFNRGRACAATEWRRWLIHAIKDAKLTPWPDAWYNLRRSARTDAEKRFPNHVCNAWFGHSAKIAERHYLMIDAATWNAAADSGLAPDPIPKPKRRAVRRGP